MYASPSCEFVLHVDAQKAVGKPFLVFLRPDDMAPFIEQVDVARSSKTFSYMRFCFQSPKRSQEVSCDAMLFPASDGIVVLMRRCRPFIRRQLVGRMNDHGPGDDGYSLGSESSGTPPLSPTMSLSSSLSSFTIGTPP